MGFSWSSSWLTLYRTSTHLWIYSLNIVSEQSEVPRSAAKRFSYGATYLPTSLLSSNNSFCDLVISSYWMKAQPLVAWHQQNRLSKFLNSYSHVLILCYQVNHHFFWIARQHRGFPAHFRFIFYPPKESVLALFKLILKNITICAQNISQIHSATNLKICRFARLGQISNPNLKSIKIDPNLKLES